MVSIEIAVEFYDHVGATPVFEWDAPRTKEFRVYRLEGNALVLTAAKVSDGIAIDV